MSQMYGYASFGGPECEAFFDVTTPAPGSGELLVAVRAAGVNPADCKRRTGYLSPTKALDHPIGLGREIAGVVIALGEGVSEFALGDAVLGAIEDDGGGLATHALLPAERTAAKPAGVSFIDAATLPIAAATAYDGIVQLALSPGETLLINGVGGGVGVAAAQIAIEIGIRVVGTASAQKREFVESLGVVHVPSGPNAADGVRAATPRVDGLFDLVGGEVLETLASLVPIPARVITAADRPTVERLGGSGVERARTREVLEAVVRLVERGALQPFANTIFSFDQTPEAMRLVESGHATGKVVVQMVEL